MLRLVSSCLIVVAVSAACENSADPLLGFPGGLTAPVSPTQHALEALDSIDEVLLMMAWFRAHPDALRRTTKYEEWM